MFVISEWVSYEIILPDSDILDLLKSCTGCRSQRGFRTGCAGWSTSRFLYMPVYISDLQTLVARSALRASSSGDLVVPPTRRRIGDRAFSVAAPRAWNTQPPELKLLRSTTTFHHQLKTLSLSHSAYGHREDWWFFCDTPSVFSRSQFKWLRAVTPAILSRDFVARSNPIKNE